METRWKEELPANDREPGGFVTLGATQPHARKVSFMTNAEAALLLWARRGAQPVRTQADLDLAIDFLTNSGDDGEKIVVFKHRHPWSVFGGFLAPDGAFVGWLTQCLRLSGFE